VSDVDNPVLIVTVYRMKISATLADIFLKEAGNDASEL
jgi:hypothetical protein